MARTDTSPYSTQKSTIRWLERFATWSCLLNGTNLSSNWISSWKQQCFLQVSKRENVAKELSTSLTCKVNVKEEARFCANSQRQPCLFWTRRLPVMLRCSRRWTRFKVYNYTWLLGFGRLVRLPSTRTAIRKGLTSCPWHRRTYRKMEPILTLH